MGLDIVELILAIEDAFKIHIADEEASRAATVGDLHELVVSKLQVQDSKRCLTSAAFYRTRRAMVEVLGIERRAIRPATALAGLLPSRNRREKWGEIQRHLNLDLPDLEYSASVATDFPVAGGIVGAALGLYARVGYAWLPLFFILGLIAGAVLKKLSPSLAISFPNRAATVGDLARDVLAINHARLADELGGWSDDKSVWDTLCRVIELQTGVAREEITPDARIVRDLGID